MAIGFFDVLLVIAVGRLLFHVPVVGSPTLVLALSGVFLAAALGIGLFISVIAPSQQTAMTIAFMATLLPTILLSGFVFPIRAMPVVLQWFTNIIPATALPGDSARDLSQGEWVCAALAADLGAGRVRGGVIGVECFAVQEEAVMMNSKFEIRNSKRTADS